MKARFPRYRADDIVYYALLFWGALRRESLRKLVKVSESNLRAILGRVNPPAKEAGSLINGQALKIVQHDERPCTKLGGQLLELGRSYKLHRPDLKKSHRRPSQDFYAKRVELPVRVVLLLQPGEEHDETAETAARKTLALKRHTFWVGILVAELAGAIDVFLPGVTTSAPFAVLPALFLDHDLNVVSQAKAQQAFDFHEEYVDEEPTSAVEAIEENESRPEDAYWQGIGARLRYLPDALFVCPEGSFFVEVELTQKKRQEYKDIFQKIRSAGVFVLYLAKSGSKNEQVIRLEDWAESKSADEQLAFDNGKLGLSQRLTEEWVSDSSPFRDCMAVIRLDSPSYNTDCEEAGRRITARFSENSEYPQNIGYERFRTVFESTSGKWINRLSPPLRQAPECNNPF